MSDKLMILDHRDEKWVARAGLVLLDLIAKSEKSIKLPLSDFLVIISYINQQADQHLASLRTSLLNALLKYFPQYTSDIEGLELFAKEADVPTKKLLSNIFNEILFSYPHQQEIIEYVKREDENNFGDALNGLFRMTSYVMDEQNRSARIQHSGLIWETMRQIAQKLPSDMNLTPIYAGNPTEKNA